MFSETNSVPYCSGSRGKLPILTSKKDPQGAYRVAGDLCHKSATLIATRIDAADMDSLVALASLATFVVNMAISANAVN
jgi:hypothetical protein